MNDDIVESPESVTCHTCNGAGKDILRPDDMTEIETDCGTCNGEGEWYVEDEEQ